MKSKILFSLAILLNLSQIYSQIPQWRELKNSPPIGQRYEDVFFINQNTGWVIGIGGATYKTTDGGNSWAHYSNVSGNRSVGFFDSQTGIIGTLGTFFTAGGIYRTTNGGVNYSQVTLPKPVPKGICGISIVNQNVAYCCGRYYSDGKVLKTTDKGMSWTLVFSDTTLARTLVDCYFWSVDSGVVVGGYNSINYLVSRQFIIVGYNLFSFTLAS